MAQGLNFQTHQYVDPSEQLQKSLGAGGMFAQTLKGMQQFDQDEAKLQMMRQDRERQAKLDAEHTEDRAALKAEKAANTGLRSALFDGQIKDAATSLGYENLSAADKATIDTRSDYSGLNVSNANVQNKSYLDQLTKAGVKAGDSLFDDLSYKVANYKDGDKYDGTSQVVAARDVYKKLGKADTDALSLASKDYGISEKDGADILKRNSLQLSLGKKANEMATAAPYQETDSKIVHDYIAKTKAAGGLTTDGMLDSAHQAKKNDIAALAEHQKLLDSYSEKLATKTGDREDKQLATNIEMTKMKMQHLESGLKLLTGRGGSSSSDDDGMNSKTVKHTYETDALNAVYSTLKGITGTSHVKNADAVREATVMANTMIKNGASPAQIQNTLRDSLLGQNEGEKTDAFNKLKFKSVGGYESLRASPEDMARYEYAGGKASNANASAAYKAEADNSLALLKQMASGGTASIDAQIGALNKKVSELNRTSGQALKDTATHDMQQWAVESGLSGATADQTARDNIYKAAHKEIPVAPISPVVDAIDKTTTSKLDSKKTYGAEPIKDTVLAKFALPSGYNSLPVDKQHGVVNDQSYALISQVEGTKKDPYAIYKDSLKKPTTGTGILVSGFEKAMLGGKSYDPSNEAHKDLLDTYQVKVKNDSIKSAYRQANEFGFSADAVPILASVNYQLGNKWDSSKFKDTRSDLIKGDYDSAIKRIQDSLWMQQTPSRAKTFIAAIEQQKAFKESGKLDGVKKYYIESQDKLQSKTLQDALAFERTRMDSLSNAPVSSFMTTAEKTQYQDPNVRWIDRNRIENAAENKQGSQVIQARDNSQTILAHSKSNDFKKTEALKLQDQLNEKTGTSANQINLLKEYGYGSQYLMMTPAERIAVIQHIQNSPGYKLKQGLIH
jgi:hypothetical protein